MEKQKSTKQVNGDTPEIPPVSRIPWWAWVVAIVFVVGLGAGLYFGWLIWGP